MASDLERRSPPPLLEPDEPAAFSVVRPHGRSPFFFTADHAGCRIPRVLGDLGVAPGDRVRHIAWDIGIAGVARRLGESLDAFTILQTYSRLVIDANRHPGSAQSIVTVSEQTGVPGNEGLQPADADRRAAEIFAPYHQRIEAELDARARDARDTVLVTLHSFTPVYLGNARPWHAGVLHDRERRLGNALLPLLRSQPELVIGENEPYAASDATDYTLVVHGEKRGLLCVEIEIRQDLIADEDGQGQWANRLGRLLPLALHELAATGQGSSRAPTA